MWKLLIFIMLFIITANFIYIDFEIFFLQKNLYQSNINAAETTVNPSTSRNNTDMINFITGKTN